MLIRLGTYSIKFKTFFAEDLGLGKEYKDIKVEFLQKVFHIWYVPIFPAEKHYRIKSKVTNDLIKETSASLRTAINLKLLKLKTPFWSYTGSFVVALPILLVFGWFLYNAGTELKRDFKKKQRTSARISDKEVLVANPAIGDVYTFKILEVEAVTNADGHVANYKANPYFAPETMDYELNFIKGDSLGFLRTPNQKFLMYGNKVLTEFSLAKNQTALAIKGYQDYKILAKPNVAGAKTKLLVGIFEIKKEPVN